MPSFLQTFTVTMSRCRRTLWASYPSCFHGMCDAAVADEQGVHDTVDIAGESRLPRR